jgi:hypothetical protein
MTPDGAIADVRQSAGIAYGVTATAGDAGRRFPGVRPA